GFPRGSCVNMESDNNRTVSAARVRPIGTPRRLLLLTAAAVLLALYGIPVTAYLARRPLVVLWLVSAAALASLWHRAEGRRRRRAAEMYRQGPPCPVLVSGGKVDPDSPEPPCARVMREFLLHQGVAASDLIEEDASRSTYENAVESARLLGARGLRKVLLVTD